MKKLMLLLLLSPIVLRAQHIPTLKDAVSNKDTIVILKKQVSALDARLTTCENASADSSTVFKKKQEAMIEIFKTEKRRRYWRGVKHGFVISFLTIAGYLAFSKFQ